MPYLGCKSRCIFCAQEVQTGKSQIQSLEECQELLAQCHKALEQNHTNAQPSLELAFYGGTFTALPESIFSLCLDFASRMRDLGLITSFRCSTRPDSLALKKLQALKANGCNLVELGVQSFNDDALAKSGRGYSGETAKDAFSQLAEAGIDSGAQLMPGLPGGGVEIFLEDVRRALSLGAKCLRFYPCLVLAGSPLAQLWRASQFSPWSLNKTIETLARGWLMATRAQIPVIRMGLAPQTGLREAVLAGPCHNALGNRVMGLAALLAVRELLPRPTNFRLYAPDFLQGCVYGWRNELLARWQCLGLEQLCYWKEDKLRIEWQEA